MRRLLPGLAVCAAAAAVAGAINHFVPAVSALLIAILLGVLVANIVPVPEVLKPGIAISAKRVLRIGIVLLGFQLALGAIASLGWGMIAVVVAVVGIGMLATVGIGALLKIGWKQRLLIASGFSICGAAAVAAASSVVEAEDEESATALALVVTYGTLMIPFVPLAGRLIGLSDQQTGLWAGASVHEVAQVAAIGGSLGASALAAAIIVKLARVLMLVPVMAGLALLVRNRRTSHSEAPRSKPPIVPLFVAGFIAAMLIASTGVLPHSVLAVIKIAQTALLAMAMFALGLGVRLRQLFKVGGRPIVLGLLSTLVMLAVGLIGVQLVGVA